MMCVGGVSSNLQESKFGKDMMKSWFLALSFDEASNLASDFGRRFPPTVQFVMQLLNPFQIGRSEFVVVILFKCFRSKYKNRIENDILTQSVSRVHGSAPDIEGKHIANPLASIRSAALMLRHLGYVKGANRLDNAVDHVIREAQVLTPDLGGKSKTEDVVAAVLRQI